MKQFGESTAKKLALDSVPVESIFHFEGENYKEKQKVYCHAAICCFVGLGMIYILLSLGNRFTVCF
jgi:hypothetical protein